MNYNFFFVFESVYFICCYGIMLNMLNLYEQPGEIHDSIKEANTTQSKFANDVVSR